MTAPGSPPPGWYPTPAGTTAWWDGQRWHQTPPQQTPTPGVAAPAQVAGQVPGQVPGQAAAQPGGPALAANAPYVKVATLGAMVKVWFVLVALFGLGQAGVSLWRRELVDEVLSGQAVSGTTLTNADDLARVASIGGLVAWIFAFVLAAIWCKRVFANLAGPLRSRGLDYTPGWAAGWWFVPFANFVKPVQVVREAWKASSPAEQPDSMAWKVAKAPATISIWWAFVVLSILVGFTAVSNDDSSTALRPSEFQDLMVRTAAVGSLRFVMGILAVAVFGAVTKRHLARARWLGVVAP
ncbi:MAG: DUF4328 domain-containing protein [Acidimicrobiales bacterium]